MKITTAELFNYNKGFYREADLLRVLDSNKEDIDELLSELDADTEAIIKKDFNNVIKTIKTYKRIQYLRVKRGAPISFEADGMRIIVPFVVDGADASIEMRMWPRVKSFKRKLDMLRVAFQSNKIQVEWFLYKERGINRVRITLVDPLQNDRFWNVLRLTLRK